MDEPVRILVVDDSATIRTALQLILAPTGHTVEFAVTGAEAIECALQRQPTMVLLDFILPDMRGTEVCRALLADARTRAVPVVLVSARGAEIRQAYQDVDNVVAYLTKPFTPDQVHDVVQDVLALVDTGFAPTTPPRRRRRRPRPPPPRRSRPPRRNRNPTRRRRRPIDDELEDELGAETPPPAATTTPREALEAIFETLRAGLEGVHVEEADTPAGAAADQSLPGRARRPPRTPARRDACPRHLRRPLQLVRRRLDPLARGRAPRHLPPRLPPGLPLRRRRRRQRPRRRSRRPRPARRPPRRRRRGRHRRRARR
ncbi:MAG: response regulator [Candidatus Binatia bacterium]